METSNQKAIGKSFLLGLTLLFILAQIIFVVKVVEHGNREIVGFVPIAVYFFVVIFLFYQGYGWAKWALSISLVVFSMLSFLAGIENDSTILKLISIYCLYFGIIPHFSVYLQSLTAKESIPSNNSITEQEDSFHVQEAIYEYPLLLKRYQATLIDGMLILTVTLVAFIINDGNETGQVALRILFFIVVLSYEPFLTSYAVTTGQKLTGIRVRNINNPNQRINLAQAYLRFFIKGVLGWLSFITIHSNPERRAIHDLAGSSIVIKAK